MKKIITILIISTGMFFISPKQASAQVSVGVSISAQIAPPPLPVYSQPPCPYDGYLWIPGYWAFDNGYYWVPGVWVRPPQIGFLWTPAYWGYVNGIYLYNPGYWGPHVGFYGGVNYGYGYCGNGFIGGRWEGRSFRYNTAVVHVNTLVVHNTYVDRTVIVNNTSRTSFNGGPRGISVRPTQQELSMSREHHIQATATQNSHIQAAARDRNQFASANNGRPSTTSMNTVGGHRYNPQGNSSNAQTHYSNGHSANGQSAIQHETIVHGANHPSNNHPSETAIPNQGNHHAPAAMDHQQAYNNHQHYPQQHDNARPQQHDNPYPQQHDNPHSQQYENPHPQQQQHNPAPEQHRESSAPQPHPKEH